MEKTPIVVKVLLILYIFSLDTETCRAAFTFTLNVISHSTNFNCLGDDLDAPCETFFLQFCLRERRSSSSPDASDCPLGTAGRLDGASGTKMIQSNQPWQGSFQLLLRAYDDDQHFSSPDFLDNIFFNEVLAPNSGLSHRITSTGSNRRVTVTMTFSVVCQQHCYGRDCLTVCRPQNDQNGHFSCSQTDGSHVCLPNYYSLPNCLVFCEATDNSNGHFTCNPNDGSHVCLPNYYGLPNCLTFCQPQDDDQNGHYTCNQADGSRECLENFYGPDCLVFCRASNNDSDGHYTCDPRNGTKICNVGFTNPEDSCRENIDDCAVSPCSNEGNCTDLVAGFYCFCVPGYTGKNCSIEILECLEAECPENSTCVDGINSFTCACHPGFEGESCTAIQPCDSSPCDHGATCVSSDPFNFTCLCSPGYSGTTCQVNDDDCKGVTCPQDMVCQDGINEFSCTAAAGNQGNNPLSDDKIVIVGSVAGVLVVVILLIIIMVVIIIAILLKRKKQLPHRGERSGSHVYQPSPSIEKISAKDTEPMDTSVSTNPLYAFQDSSFSPQDTGSQPTRVFDNILYEDVALPSQNGNARYEPSTRNGIAPIYAELNERKDPLVVSTNISYGSVEKERDPMDDINNPLYILESEGKSASSKATIPLYRAPSPYEVPTTSSSRDKSHYQVPRPAEATMTTSGATATPMSTSNTNAYEIIELKHKQMAPQEHKTGLPSSMYSYATCVPTIKRSPIPDPHALPPYNKLEHESQNKTPQNPTRFATTEGLGYEIFNP